MKAIILLAVLLNVSFAQAEEVTVKGVVWTSMPPETYPLGVSKVFQDRREHYFNYFSFAVDFTPGVFAGDPTCVFNCYGDHQCKFERDPSYRGFRVVTEKLSSPPDKISFICVGEKP